MHEIGPELLCTSRRLARPSCGSGESVCGSLRAKVTEALAGFRAGLVETRVTGRQCRCLNELEHATRSQDEDSSPMLDEAMETGTL